MSKLFLLFATLLMFSCNNKRETSIIKTDESQILNLTLDKVIGSDTSWRYHFKLPTPPIPKIPFTDKVDSPEYLKRVRWRDSARKVLDTASLFVAIERENECIVESYIDKIKNRIDNNKSDTSFQGVLQQLCNQNLSKDTIDITIFTPKHNFKIFDASTAPDDELRKIGRVRFSKIAFNKTKDKACIFTSFSCGEFCSNGNIHFFHKERC